MNKIKKITTAVVATVMAGTIAIPFAACTKKPDNGPSSLGNPDGQTLRMNVCDGSNALRQVAYKDGQISGTVTLLDGNTYKNGDIKPAWRAMSQELNINFTNAATGLASDKQVTENKTNMGNFDILTASADAIVQEGSSSFLDLNEYLDYMPNYKAFLEANPITRLALTSNTNTGAMYYAPYYDGNDDIEKYELMNKNWVSVLLGDTASTSTTTYKSQLEAKASVKASTAGYNTQVTAKDATKAYITAFMGSEDWEIEVATSTGGTEKVYVKYSKAKAATDTAFKAIAGCSAGYTGESGNIVDIMNVAINNSKGEVTGPQLQALLNAYIDGVYCKQDGTKYYATRADVFNGINAAWDVDLLAAYSRVLVTNRSALTGSVVNDDKNLYAIAGRNNTMQRNGDVLSLVGELYGVRGLAPRYQYTYLTKSGELKDARGNEATYDAMNRMNGFAKEGLLYLSDAINSKPSITSGMNDKATPEQIAQWVLKTVKEGEKDVNYYFESTETVFDKAHAKADSNGFLLKDGKTYSTGGQYAQTAMMYDYVQTQTANGFKETDISKYNFAPIVTPVSKWDTDDDGTRDTTMRFTESWRSVKNTGIAVPKLVANDGNKLAAVLKFIDYIYSNDGQITLTFGKQATDNATNDGWWYATKVTNVQLDEVATKVAGSDQYTVKSSYASQYFIYKNEVYTGLSYKGTQIPVLRDKVLQLFKGETVDGLKLGDGDIAGLGNSATNYTDFARGVLGSALPLGPKNQGFEYQCTAQCGIDGAAIVGDAIAAGVIKHATPTIDATNYWYTLVPTTVPYSTADQTQMKDTYSPLMDGMFNQSNKQYRNALLDVCAYGFGYTAEGFKLGNYTSGATSIPATAKAMNDLIRSGEAGGAKIAAMNDIMNSAWQTLKTYYNSLNK